MTASDNLPAEWSSVTSEGSLSDTHDVVPGSWWRLTGSFDGLEDQEAPVHGMIFLLGEARVIDGDIHTVVLHDHPLYGRGTFLVLIADLLNQFTLEADGERLREVELAALMGEITDITAELSNPPSDADLLKALPLPAEDDAKTENRSVPSVLLPSGDINAAQRRIEQALAVVESRKNWVETRTGSLTEKMNLVARYQTEKVSVGLAGISEQRKWAETMLENVQTMRLWLGDDQTFTTLVEGEGAPRDEPLHFMQRMLYLDEEIFTHSRLAGFTSEDLADLGKILNENPALIERMMPHKRCVIIAKVRRKDRPFKMPEDISGIFRLMDEMESDKLIQILVRNGDQVHLIATDEITSKANRLFPSKREIDAIFTHKASYSSEARMITPHDIEYSDKRADHDSRALFYKRILLILWGLAEREGILGDFIGEGVNWLEETVHSEAFRFVHDEDGTISDGRPSILTYLKDNRNSVRAGSLILANWSSLVTEDTADHLYESQNYNTNYRHRRSDPVDDFSIASVAKRGRELVVPCEVSKYSYSTSRDRTYNTKIRIGWERTSYGKRDMYMPDGFLCLDDIKAEDLRYYFESRIHRTHYLQYIHLFDRALSYLEADADARKVAEATVASDTGVDVETASRALTMWRSANKGYLPDSFSKLAKVSDLAKLIATGCGDLEEDAIYIDLTATGALEVAKLHVMDIFDLDLKFALVETHTHTKRKGWVRKSIKTVEIDTVAGPGRLRLYSNLDAAVIEDTQRSPAPLADPQAAMRVYCGPSWDVPEDLILPLINGSDEVDYSEVLRKCVSFSKAQTGSSIEFPQFSRTIGYAYDPGEHGGHLYRFELYVHPVLQTLNLGHDDLIHEMMDGYYENPSLGFDRMKSQLASKMRDGGPFGIKVFRVGSTEEIIKDKSYEEADIVSVSRAMILLPRAGSDTSPEEVEFFPKSIRELLIMKTVYAGRYGKPDTAEKVANRVNEVMFGFNPQYADLVEKMTGWSLGKVGDKGEA